MLDGSGQQTRYWHRPTGGFPVTENPPSSGSMRATSSSRHVSSTPCLSPCPHWIQELAYRATPHQGEGTARWGREWGWRKADTHTGQGRTPESMTHQNCWQETNTKGLVHGEEQEMIFVGKASVFSVREAFAFKPGKCRWSNDTRSGTHPFLKVP